MRKTMVVCAMACALAGAARAQKVEKVDIIMATLAPTDSQWYKVMENMGAEWKKISNGNVNLSIRAGGVVGDDPDAVRRLRSRSIQAAALTSAGLGDIDQGVAALQIPMMFDNYEELDYVRDRIAPRLEKRILDKGYLVLNWGDAGWVQFFSTRPIHRLDDLRRLKLFTSPGEKLEPAQIVKSVNRPGGEELYPAGVAPIQYQVTFVQDSLFESGCDTVAHVIQLFVVVEHHGDLEGGHALVDVAQASTGQGRGLDRPGPQPADGVRVVAHDATGADGQVDIAVGYLLPFGAHVLHHLVPLRIGGRERGHNDVDLLDLLGASRSSESARHRANNHCLPHVSSLFLFRLYPEE